MDDEFPVQVYVTKDDYIMIPISLSAYPADVRKILANKFDKDEKSLVLVLNNKMWNEDATLKDAMGSGDVVIKVLEKKVVAEEHK